MTISIEKNAFYYRSENQIARIGSLMKFDATNLYLFLILTKYLHKIF